MEDAVACPKCHSNMFVHGNRMECRNPDCPYGYDVPIKMPTYEQLLAENTRLVFQSISLHKMLEDICECQGSRDELIDEARRLLLTL